MYVDFDSIQHGCRIQRWSTYRDCGPLGGIAWLILKMALGIKLHDKRFVKCIKYHGFRETVLRYITPFWLLIFSRKSDFSMSYSRILAELDYLLMLGISSSNERKDAIGNMTCSQMESWQILILQILLNRILIMQRDTRHFQCSRRLLRALVNDQISLRRKKGLMLTFYATIPRLLRYTYNENGIFN